MFEFDDQGALVVKDDGTVDPSDPSLFAAVSDAVACCPVEALRAE